jgi:glycerophosphoryl diester phosphodiesterase
LRRQIDLEFPPALVLGDGIQAESGWNVQFVRIGHACGAAHGPANTLRACAKALEMGIDMVEVDVRPCRDELVLLHDDDLSRVAARPGLASEHTLQELLEIDLGEGARIATLAEVADLIRGRTLLNVDLKAEGIESRVIDVLEEKGVLADALISSLRPDSLRRVRQRAPAARTAISYPEDRAQIAGRAYLQPVVSLAVWITRVILPYRILALVASAQANGAMLYHGVVSTATVRRVHEARGRVFVWTVDDLPTLRIVRAMGADGVASNRPELFQRV